MTVTRDATSGWYVPANSTEWTELLSGTGIGNPVAAWQLQEAAGNFADSIGGFTLTDTAMVHQMTVPGWTRKGAGYSSDGGVPNAKYGGGGLGDIDTTSHLMLAYVYVAGAPAATRDLFGMGDGGSYRGAQLTTTPRAKATPNDASATATGSNNPQLQVTARPMFVRVNRTTGSWSVITETEVITPSPYTAPPAAADAVFIGSALTGVPVFSIVYAACWRGASAELTDTQIGTLLQRLQSGPFISTLATMQAGSFSMKWVAVIEGCKYLLTDAPPAAALAAGYSADFTQALGGLFVDLRNSQSIDPDSAFTKHGTCKLRVLDQDRTDVFGVYVNKRLSGAETELAATADRDDTTLTVRSTTGFPASGEVYIGTECIGYTGTTATTFTGCTRGKYSPLGCDSTGSGGSRFGNHHRVGVDARYIQRNPLVTQLPRRWIGKRVAVFLHVWDPVAGTINNREGAQLVFAGRIAGLADDKDTFETVIELEHFGAEWKNAVIGRDILQANVAPGLQLVAGRRFTIGDWKHGAAVKSGNDLEVVTSGAVGTNQINAGYYNGEEIVSAINRWLGAEKAAGRIWGFYTWTYGKSTNVGLRTTVNWAIEDASIVPCDWGISMPGEVCAFLGLKSYEGDPRGQSGAFKTTGKTNYDDNIAQGDGVPYRTLIFKPAGPGHSQEFSEGLTYELEDERGTFLDQYTLLPTLIKTAAQSGYQWGVFLLDDKQLIVGAYANGVLSNCWVTPYQRVSDNESDAVTYVGRRLDESGPVTLRQVYMFETTLSTFLLSLAYSTGVTGYNHGSYDTLAANLGFAMPGEVLGPEFERSILNLPGANAPIAIRIDEPTKLATIIEDDLKMRRAFVRWKDQHFEVCQWRTPLIAIATFTLNEANKAAPAGSDENHRMASEETDDYHRPSVKIDYERDFATSRGGSFLKSISVEDQASVDDSGSSATNRAAQLSMRNTYSQFSNTGAAVEQLVPEYMSTMPMFSESSHRVERTIDMRQFEARAPGDIGAVTDSFARDPLTGVRGIASRAAFLVRHSYTLGGPVADGDTVRDMQGNVEMMFLDVHRGEIYSPSADIDSSASSGGFTAGYNAATKTIRCTSHSYSQVMTLLTLRGFIENSEPVDASNFQTGDKVVVVERDPTNPGAPLTWQDTVASTPVGNDIPLTIGLAGFDTTKKYRVISDAFLNATGTQRDDCYQADDADMLIQDTEAPFHLSATEEAYSFITNGTDKAEWIASLSYGDGKPYDVGHDRALAATLNALIDYKTAHQNPFLWREFSTAGLAGARFEDGASVVLFMGPVFLGTEHLSDTIYRTLTVAPFFSAIIGGISAQVRVTLSRMPPMNGPSKNEGDPTGGPWGDPAFGDHYSQSAVWETFSTTWQQGADATLSIAVKDLTYGYAWLTIEGSGDVRCRGLAKCIEGPRTVRP